MRVGVVGSRDYPSYDIIRYTLSRISISLLVSGGGGNADLGGERYADENGIEKLIFPADWKQFGKGAGFIRNTDIVKNSDVIIAFWDGKSRGTQDTLRKAIKMDVPYKIITPDGIMRPVLFIHKGDIVIDYHLPEDDVVKDNRRWFKPNI